MCFQFASWPLRLLYFFLLAFVLLSFPRQAPAAYPDSAVAEHITLFDATAIFEPTGVMEVTETITVQADGDRIRRGIFRTLPLRWKRNDGKRYAVRYEVKSVLRDGNPEPYSLTRDGEALTIRVGSKDVLLESGAHQYAIVYNVSNHFSRFPDWDELYWNVTGNDWDFPIDKAVFRLMFRSGPVAVRSLDIYTGSRGEQGTDAQALPDGSIATTAPLRQGEGLTVAYTWPRSMLEGAPDPEEENLLKSALLPTAKTVVLWAVPTGMACFFFVALRRLWPKEGMPEIIPLFSPPHGISPGALRYILKKRYDGQSFAADLLSLVAKGALVFASDKEGDKNKMLRRATGQEARVRRQRNSLGSEEKWVLGTLFAKNNGTINLGTERQPQVRAARTYWGNQRDKEKGALFLHFASLWRRGTAAILLLPLLAGVLFSPLAAFVTTFMLIFIGVFGGFLFFFLFSMLRETEGFWSVVARLPFMLFTVPFFIALGAFCYHVLPMFLASLDMPDGYIGALAASFLISLAFYLLAPRRTAAGLERLAAAKGLIMYLGTAERARFEALYPPEDSVQHFEELLPYALALGVGKTWANRFAAYLATTGLEAEQFRDMGWRDVRGFQYSSAGASATAPSRSSGSSGNSSSSGSGSSGGGSSGGGSGGGGGGGW